MAVESGRPCRNVGFLCLHKTANGRGGEKREKTARREKRHEGREERKRCLIFLVGQNVSIGVNLSHTEH